MKYSDLLYRFALLRHFKNVYHKYPTDIVLANLMLVQSSRTIKEILKISKMLKIKKQELKDIVDRYDVSIFTQLIWEIDQKSMNIGLEMQ